MVWLRGCCLILFVALALAFAPAFAEAQTPTRPAPTAGFHVFGVHGAITAAKLAGAGDQTSWGPGFFAGMFYTHKPDLISWQVEGMYHRKGGKYGDVTVNISQIEFPFMLRINMHADRRTKFHLLAGPSVSMRLIGRLEGDPGVDFTSSLRQFEAGLVLGGGVDIGHAVIGARYMQGLQTTRIQIDGQQTRHRIIALVLGYKF